MRHLEGRRGWGAADAAWITHTQGLTSKKYHNAKNTTKRFVDKFCICHCMVSKNFLN